MNQQKRTVLDLLISALRQTPVTVPADTDWEAIFAMGKRHYILPLLYDAISRNELTVPADILGKIKAIAVQSVLMDQRQMHSLRRIFDAFDENGIDYLPIKGSVMKFYYPRTDLRMMGDADVLIRERQYEAIRPVLRELGFAEEEDRHGKYDMAWDKPKALHIELHRKLVSPDNRDYYPYFGDGWQFAVKNEARPHAYSMSTADHLVYLLVHFANHYRFGGIGIRQALDFWQLFEAEPALRQNPPSDALEQLKLTAFYQNLLATLDCWFAGGEETEIVQRMTDDLFDKGAFGTRRGHDIAGELRASKMKKGRRVLSLLFPPLWLMTDHYPVLARHKWLLPVMWVYRFIEAVFRKRRSIKISLQLLKSVTPEEIAAYDEHLKSVGLEFRF